MIQLFDHSDCRGLQRGEGTPVEWIRSNLKFLRAADKVSSVLKKKPTWERENEGDGNHITKSEHSY